MIDPDTGASVDPALGVTTAAGPLGQGEAIVRMTVELLFPGTGSLTPAADTVAVLLLDVAVELMLNVLEIVTLEPADSEGMVHGNGAMQAPLLPLNVSVALGVSSTLTLITLDGPLFVTTIVNVTGDPAFTVAGAVFLIARSALTPTVVVCEAELFDGFKSVVDELT